MGSQSVTRTPPNSGCPSPICRTTIRAGRDYWRLYCLQRIEIGEGGKIYESSFVSQVVGEP